MSWVELSVWKTYINLPSFSMKFYVCFLTRFFFSLIRSYRVRYLFLPFLLLFPFPLHLRLFFVSFVVGLFDSKAATVQANNCQAHTQMNILQFYIEYFAAIKVLNKTYDLKHSNRQEYDEQLPYTRHCYNGYNIINYNLLA